MNQKQSPRDAEILKKGSICHVSHWKAKFLVSLILVRYKEANIQ